MIPLKLKLHNFMCYRDPEPLDLIGIHLACLAGDNGHGKSALLDAMTWALWGKTRARYDDELIRNGEKAMEVEFEFLLGDVRYRIIRKRELGRQSKSALEFQVQDDDQFRSLSSPTQRDTQARIQQVLHMDYDTFINSAFLLQGRADEFTLKAPAERKRVLADILGLSMYDEYEQRAKTLAREKELAEREVEARIQQIEQELEHRSQHEQELKMAQIALAQTGLQARAAEAALQELRDRLKALEMQQNQLTEVTARLNSAEAQLRQLDQQLDSVQRRMATNESILARRVEIETGYAQWHTARARVETWSAKLPQLLSLNEEKISLGKSMAEARQELELQQRVAEERCVELRRKIDPLPDWEAERTRIGQELQDLAKTHDQVEADRQRGNELTLESNTLDMFNKQLKEEMNALKERVGLLQEPTATCPLCGQRLADAERLRLIAQMEAEGTHKAEAYRQNIARHREITVQLATLRDEITRGERELKRQPALQGREATLGKSIQEATTAMQQYTTQTQAMQAVQQRLEQNSYAPQARAQLAELEMRIVALGYDQAAHEQARQTVAALAGLEAEKAQLDQAQQALAEARASQQQLVAACAHWATAQAQDQQRYAELSTALAELVHLNGQMQTQQQETESLRAQEGRARQMVGAAQQKLDYCAYLARERKDKIAQRAQWGEERVLYEELQVAFGKKGLQALIIESAIPEIEVEANQLLERMSEGRMSVHFDTQRDTKGGGVIETLDLNIADEQGSRSYEMYSGGEAFRINLAVRIALSKLLARRAGARLQTLIIDEGFGTQDAEGRQHLVEAIHSIQDDFHLILVITHIEDLKDAFPVRIDVLKTPNGSQITIN